MEDYNKLMLVNKSARENLMAAAKEARLAHLAQPAAPHRLRLVIAAIAVFLGMALALSMVL